MDGNARKEPVTVPLDSKLAAGAGRCQGTGAGRRIAERKVVRNMGIRGVGILWLVAVIAGCAVRLGGPKPVEYRVLALAAGDAEEASAVASRIRATGAGVVLLGAARDTAWFSETARQASLELSGPGVRDGIAFGFLAGEPVGDTTIVLQAGGTENGVLVHDALYEVDDRRFLDLMVARIDRTVDARAAVGALLDYMATDVMPNAAIVLAIAAEDRTTAERVTRLIEPALRDARDCVAQSDEASSQPAGAASPAEPGLLLFYGPELEIRCESAEVRAESGAPIVATFVLPA